MTFRRYVVSVSGVVLAVLLAFPAFAAPDSMITDPDDMTSPLDVIKLAYIDEGGGVGTLKLETDARWACKYLRPRLTTIKWFFDGAADGDVDLLGNLRCQNGRLWMYLRGTDSGNNYEPAPANRPNKRTVRVTMSFDLTELEGDNLAVKVKVRDGAAEGCSDTEPCNDRAPDTGWWAVF